MPWVALPGCKTRLVADSLGSRDGSPSLQLGKSAGGRKWKTSGEKLTRSDKRGRLISILQKSDYFEAEGFGLPCTARAGLGLLVKSRLIKIRADEGPRERTRSFEIELVLAPAGRDIPIKRADWHAMIYYFMHKQAQWGNADAGPLSDHVLSTIRPR